MSDRFEKSREANELRKSGELEKALVLYRELRKDRSDSFALAGVLFCLRKQGLFEEALPLCDDIPEHLTISDWCRREITWTLVQGKLEKIDESASVEETASVANSILARGPGESTTRWRIVHRVLKTAKSHNKWDVISQWIDRVNAEELSTVPMKDDRGKEGWCDQAIWHHYHIRSVIETGDKEQAISLSLTAADRFPHQRKFFERLEALAKLRLTRLAEAERVYGHLCSTGRPDWWILHEYAQVLRELGKPEEALRLMCKAAVSRTKLESLVSLFSDMGFLCRELQLREDAVNHLLLCRYVREGQGWSVPRSVDVGLSDLSKELTGLAFPTDLKDALTACRAFWFRTLGTHDDPRVQSLKDKKIRQTLWGKLTLGHPERPFCFISSESGESYFCLKSDLPKDITDGVTLVFDAIPSFDRKKNRESWKAANIRSKAGS